MTHTGAIPSQFSKYNYQVFIDIKKIEKAFKIRKDCLYKNNLFSNGYKRPLF